MVDHFVQCYGQCGRLTLNHHRQCVADEDGVNSRLIQHLRGWKVIRGQHRNFSTLQLHRGKPRNRDSLIFFHLLLQGRLKDRGKATEGLLFCLSLSR